MTVAVEGAEDSVELGRQDLIDLKLTEMIWSLGSRLAAAHLMSLEHWTMQVKSGLPQERSPATNKVAKTCQLPDRSGLRTRISDRFYRIEIGDCSKLILNMISTISMVGIGKVYNNLMVDVKPANDKLVERAKENHHASYRSRFMKRRQTTLKSRSKCEVSDRYAAYQ